MYEAGQFLEVAEGKTVRLNKDTAEIANAAVEKKEAEILEPFIKAQIAHGDGLRVSPAAVAHGILSDLTMQSEDEEPE